MSIDLARVVLVPDKVELIVGQKDVSSPPITVQLSPQKQSREGIKDLTVRLIPKDAGDQADSSSSFESRELWIQHDRGVKPAEPGQRRQASEAMALDQPFRVFVLPDSAKKSRTFTYQLRVEGSGIDPAEGVVRILVSPPQVELQSRELTVHSVAGTTRQASILCRLKANQPNDEELVYIDGGGESATFLFRGKEPNSHVEVQLGCPGLSTPIRLQSQSGAIAPPSADDKSTDSPPGADQWVSIPLTLSIPETTPFGRFDCVLKLAGSRITPQEVTIHLVVNSLRVEWPFRIQGQNEFEWRPIESQHILQFFDQKMRKTIRVRTELNDPLQPGDLQPRFMGPFEDDAGDAQYLPRVGDVRPLPDQQGLEVDLDFSEVVNANPGNRYRVQLRLENSSLHIPAKAAEFQIWYMKPGDLLAR